MVTESDLLRQVYKACAFGDSGRMHPVLSARIEEFVEKMTPRQHDCLVALATEHVGSELITNAKWAACTELAEAIKLLHGVDCTINWDGESLEIWARDNTYFFTADTKKCDCDRFSREKKFCRHLMMLALILAGMEYPTQSILAQGSP